MAHDEQTTPTGGQLARLMALALDDGETTAGRHTDQSMAEHLQCRLGGPLPPESGEVPGGATAVLSRMRKDLLPEGGASVADLLLDPETPPDVLTRVKRYGKLLSNRDEPLRSVGTVIYYAAIASALMHLGEKISTHSYAYLAESYDVLTERSWLPDRLLHQFAAAAEHCRQMD